MANKHDINTNKSLSQVVAKLKNSINVSFHCIKIGEIVSFDKTDQTATVKVLHVMDNDYDIYMEQTLEYPLLAKVPVVVLGGGGTYISHPISSGDQCLLLFCDYMIDSWWVTGEAKSSIVPRKHDISDAIAIVGLNASPKAIQGYSDYLKLHYSEESNIIVGEQIDINNDNINLNGDVAVEKKAVVTESLTASGIHDITAATGSFVTADNKIVTVVDGIITKIVSAS